MVLPIWLCGAVPIQVDVDCATDTMPPVLMCCHCHVIESLAPLRTSWLLEPSAVDDLDVLDDNLPDVVPRDKMAMQSCREETDSHVKELIEISTSRQPTEGDKAESDHWKEVGRDLRRIADQFQSSRRQLAGHRTSQPSSWIQTCLLHGLAAFVGWRIQRWIAGWIFSGQV